MKAAEANGTRSLADRRRQSFKIQLPPAALAIQEVTNSLAELNMEGGGDVVDSGDTDAEPDQRPLKSCKDRVPTPYRPGMMTWLDEWDDGAISSEMEPKVLKSCKDRVPTPYAPFKAHWLD